MPVNNLCNTPASGGTGILAAGGIAASLAAYPVIHVAVSNPGQVSAWGLLVVLLGAVLVAFGLLALHMSVATGRDSALVGLIGTLFLVFAFGPAHDWLELANRARTHEAAAEFLLETLLHELLPLWLLAVSVWLLLARRLRQQHSSRIVKVLVAACGVLYLILAVRAGLGVFAGSTEPELPEPPLPGERSTSSILAYDPDVYYIVLDGYARADILDELYAHDNSAFLSALRDRGFVVSERSTVNYYWTFLSLASSLNFGYLDSLIGDPIEAKLRGRKPFYAAIRNNATASFLRARGYRYLHFQSTWGGTLKNEYADQQISCETSLFRDDFARAVVEMTPLKLLSEKFASDLAECYRSHFAALEGMGLVPGPKFVLAHFLPPHHPYLFDRNGRTLRNATISDQFEFQKRLWEEKDMYVDQLMYVNRRVLAAVDAIIAESPNPPIILIQSDHGPNLQDGLTAEEKRSIRFANLSVALLPGAPEDLLKTDESAINKVPRVLNYYFGANIPMQPDRHFYSTHSRPFELEPVFLGPLGNSISQAKLAD